jgi:anti-sigma-K factor RskA
MHRPEYEELIPLYAIGAVTPAEAQDAREHLTTCATCRELLREYWAVAEELLVQVPIVEPPPELRAKLLTRLNLRPVAAPPVVSPAPRPSVLRRFWQGTVMLPRWAAIGALVALLVLGGTLLLEQGRFVALADEIEMGRILNSPEHRTVTLEAAEEDAQARGTLYLEPESSNALLIVRGFNALPSDKAYQIWLVHDGQRDSGGLFNVRDDGRATLLIRAPRPFTSYEQIGITTEPATGSPGPTGERVCAGTLN